MSNHPTIREPNKINTREHNAESIRLKAEHHFEMFADYLRELQIEYPAEEGHEWCIMADNKIRQIPSAPIQKAIKSR